ncbi:L-histidine N(alpha)-methyltransferase [Streptomyces sp. NPDC127038]|uniref:L-histidine N(alpha)-methyltransferase n=1 Tax=Streptomyces sp. NPDC127038 TaxID=3347114 RepID=UPI00365D02F1
MSPFTVTRLLPSDDTTAALHADVRRGLGATPKSLPPKWFYDARGSLLFEQITELPTYYATRAERDLLSTRAGDIAEATGARTLIELGSGSSSKTRLLLDALPHLHTYIPVDVSESALRDAGTVLARERPALTVQALIADFTNRLTLPPAPGPRIVALLGSTIGNLMPVQRAAFYALVRELLEPGDTLLLGVDLVKSEDVLVAAYADQAVTGQFNANVLRVLNRELNADFDLDAFEHVALWDARRAWIEMRLRSRLAQTVKIPALDMAVSFAEGEDLLTEISAKFTVPGLASELRCAGLDLARWFCAPAQLVGLALATPVRSLHDCLHATGRSTACIR